MILQGANQPAKTHVVKQKTTASTTQKNCPREISETNFLKKKHAKEKTLQHTPSTEKFRGRFLPTKKAPTKNKKIRTFAFTVGKFRTPREKPKYWTHGEGTEESATLEKLGDDEKIHRKQNGGGALRWKKRGLEKIGTKEQDIY